MSCFYPIADIGNDFLLPYIDMVFTWVWNEHTVGVQHSGVISQCFCISLAWGSWKWKIKCFLSNSRCAEMLVQSNQDSLYEDTFTRENFYRWHKESDF